MRTPKGVPPLRVAALCSVCELSEREGSAGEVDREEEVPACEVSHAGEEEEEEVEEEEEEEVEEEEEEEEAGGDASSTTTAAHTELAILVSVSNTNAGSTPENALTSNGTSPRHTTSDALSSPTAPSASPKSVTVSLSPPLPPPPPPPDRPARDTTVASFSVTGTYTRAPTRKVSV